jgi:hypothetical protein
MVIVNDNRHDWCKKCSWVQLWAALNSIWCVNEWESPCLECTVGSWRAEHLIGCLHGCTIMNKVCLDWGLISLFPNMQTCRKLVIHNTLTNGGAGDYGGVALIQTQFLLNVDCSERSVCLSVCRLLLSHGKHSGANYFWAYSSRTGYEWKEDSSTLE